MISRIARKELVEMLRDGRFRVLAAAVLVASLASFAAGWRQYTDLAAQHATAQEATRAQWLAQPRKNPHAAAHYGVYAFKPKSALAMVDTGIDPYVGVATWLEAHKQNEFKYRPAQDRTALQRFGDMTGAEVLQVILPLFIVLMAFSAFAGEREQGTLRQLLSLGVRPTHLALGKAAGVGAALALVLVPATALGVAAFTLSSQGSLMADDPSRGVALGLVHLVYYAATIAFALAVSARARSSRLALVVLLSLWFANSLVAPRVAADLAAWLHPTPSAVEFQKALEQELGDEAAMQERLARRSAELLRRYKVDSVDALPIAWSGISLQEGEEHGNEVFDKHFGRLFDQYARQNDVVQRGGVVAPMLALRAASMGLAGTDFAHHRDFVAAAEAYRRNMQRVLNGDITANQRKGQVYLAGRELWEKVPPLDYEAPSLGWALQAVRPSLLIMLAWCVAAAAWLVRATRRLAAD